VGWYLRGSKRGREGFYRFFFRINFVSNKKAIIFALPKYRDRGYKKPLESSLKVWSNSE